MRPTYLLVIASIMATGFSDVPRRLGDVMQHVVEDFGRPSGSGTRDREPRRVWTPEEPGDHLQLVGGDGTFLPDRAGGRGDFPRRLAVPSSSQPEALVLPSAPMGDNDRRPSGSPRFQALAHALKMRDWQHSIDHGAICLPKYTTIEVARWLSSRDQRALPGLLPSYSTDVTALRRALSKCQSQRKVRQVDIVTLNRVIAFERKVGGEVTLYLL